MDASRCALAMVIAACALACSAGIDGRETVGGTSLGTSLGDGDGDESSDDASTSNGVPDMTGGDTQWGTSGDGDGDETWGTGDGDSCSGHAAQQGWKTFYCDSGSGVCNGAGIQTSDCDLCCSGPSCGQLADQYGWGSASCEVNGNGACGGSGTATYDCDHCCEGNQQSGNGFGYPVGDKSSSPAGGWVVTQVLAHYWDAQGGRHLAQDIGSPQGGLAAIDSPVYSVADGVVRYAGPNGSTYRNVVLIEHDDGSGGKICSFYGHINPPLVATNDNVSRGQQISSIRDWALCANGGSSTNTHLHYVLLSKALCDASANAGGSLICGYDTGGPNNVVDLATEPYTYTAIGDICGDSNYANSFISPTKFIDDHHF